MDEQAFPCTSALLAQSLLCQYGPGDSALPGQPAGTSLHECWCTQACNLFLSFFPAMSQAVQTNGTQPLSKTWELSLYELQRTPQVTRAKELAFRQRACVCVRHGSVRVLFCLSAASPFKRTVKLASSVRKLPYSFLKNFDFYFTPGSNHRWLGNCGVTQEPAQRADVPHLFGYVKKHHDDKGVFASLLR